MLANLPRVTVCVPVRNGGLTIRRTLDSILAQDYPNFEVIVSDNCSTDDTAQIVRDYAERGVKYYLNPKMEASGESNWNNVLSLAQGPLIAVYHADDIYTPTMVRRQVSFLQAHPTTSAVFTQMQHIDEQDRPTRMGRSHVPGELAGQNLFPWPEFFNAVLKYGTFTPVPTMMTRREVIDAVGVFNWQLCGSASDIDLYLRMAYQWGAIGLIDEPLHLYRVSEQQGTALIARNRIELADFFRAIDLHLSNPDERQYAEPQALALYQAQRAGDRIVCAMHLLVQGKIAEARVMLQPAMHMRYFRSALKNPRLLLRLMMGVCFLVSIRLGLGTLLGKLVYRIHQRDLQRRRQPLRQGT